MYTILRIYTILKKNQRIILNFVNKTEPAVKARIGIIIFITLLAMQYNAFAGGLYAGIFNSYRGFGISMDYAATEDIINSYNLYADVYGMYDETHRNPGIKLVYLHYNKLATIDARYARYDLYLGPGASTGYVWDHAADRRGIILTADLGMAFRACFKRNIDMELGMFAELGFVSGESGGKTQIKIYQNGLLQALIPTLKIMYHF